MRTRPNSDSTRCRSAWIFLSLNCVRTHTNLFTATYTTAMVVQAILARPELFASKPVANQPSKPTWQCREAKKAALGAGRLQVAIDSRNQIFYGHGLGEVRVSTGLQSPPFVLGTAPGCNDDDGNI